jgi:hypothetical protein
MNETFLYSLGFTLYAALVYFIALRVFPHRVTLKEVGIGVAVQAVVISVFHFVVSYSSGLDVQVLNGEITNKENRRVSCSHSYPCNCVTHCSGGKHRTCSLQINVRGMYG